MLRCKFEVKQVSKSPAGRHLCLKATSSRDGDDLDHSQAIPGGSVELWVSHKSLFETIDRLEPGDLMWLDLNVLPADPTSGQLGG